MCAQSTHKDSIVFHEFVENLSNITFCPCGEIAGDIAGNEREIFNGKEKTNW